MKKIKLDNFPYIGLGISMIVFSSPLLYLTIAASLIDIQNLFGATIDRRSVSYNTNDPLIQAMNLVGIIGIIVLAMGYFKSKIKNILYLFVAKCVH